MNKNEWYKRVSDYIAERLELFCSTFYTAEVVDLGPSGYRLNPCPKCGHDDCATIGVAVNCFSCGWKGTYISAYYEYAQEILGISLWEATKNLSDFAHCPFPTDNKDDVEEYEAEQVRQNIWRFAEHFYHEELMICEKVYDYRGRAYTPINYLKAVRERDTKSIVDLKIGFTTSFFELRKRLLSKGYTKDQIKESKVFIPDGLFCFFYKDPVTNEYLRLNTKNPFEVIRKDTGKIITGHSRGQKTIMCTPRFDFNKPIVVVEGEHDLASVYEQGWTNAACIGGNLGEDQWRPLFERATQEIYCFFDDDHKGQEYLTVMDKVFPDKMIYQVPYPGDHEDGMDPDNYFKLNKDVKLKDLIGKAKMLPVTSDRYKVYHHEDTWWIQNREQKLEFIISRRNDKGKVTGTINLYGAKGNLIDREVDKELTNAKANKKPFNYHLYDRMDKHFNSDIYNKSAEELIDIFWVSSRRQEIIKQLAAMVYESNNDIDLINKIKVGLRTSDGKNDIVDAILIEANDIQNKTVSLELADIPKIKVSQYFNVKNNDGYIYFANYTVDGDTLRRLPFLLKNDKTLIRLDLLKRKDPQCLLLINNKYELPMEINEIISDPSECSLRKDMVDKYINNQIDPASLRPKVLADSLCDWYKRFFCSVHETEYKMLALYTLFTYYYELFQTVPYLYLNGNKGTGKSVLAASLYLFCFNAKMATDISEAALFRISGVEGGTIILDEMENLTSRTQGKEGSMGPVLKGGYKRDGNIYRADVDSRTATVKFDSYGPKVIANIMGLDDIIYDRCIEIRTYPYAPVKGQRFEDPRYYRQEEMEVVRELTSRCCLSALENFREVSEIQRQMQFLTFNYRLSEIVTPLIVMARLVDKEEREATGEEAGTYEKAMVYYYNHFIKGKKEEMDKTTPEGIIRRLVPAVALELYDKVPMKDRQYTIPENHNKYSEPIKFNKEEGWFELNTLHFKCFIEEQNGGEITYTKIITRWIKTSFNIDSNDIRRVTATIENDDLAKEMKGNRKPRVNAYRFYFRDYLPELSNKFLEHKEDIKTIEPETDENILFKF